MSVRETCVLGNHGVLIKSPLEKSLALSIVEFKEDPELGLHVSRDASLSDSYMSDRSSFSSLGLKHRGYSYRYFL